MSKKLKLTKIALETKKGIEVELTITEAKELYQQLDSLFGIKETHIPSYPIVIDRDRWRPPFSPYWYDAVPKGTDITTLFNDAQCKVEGNSGLSVSYCGEAV